MLSPPITASSLSTLSHWDCPSTWPQSLLQGKPFSIKDGRIVSPTQPAHIIVQLPVDTIFAIIGVVSSDEMKNNSDLWLLVGTCSILPCLWNIWIRTTRWEHCGLPETLNSHSFIAMAGTTTKTSWKNTDSLWRAVSHSASTLITTWVNPKLMIRLDLLAESECHFLGRFTLDLYYKQSVHIRDLYLY